MTCPYCKKESRNDKARCDHCGRLINEAALPSTIAHLDYLSIRLDVVIRHLTFYTTLVVISLILGVLAAIIAIFG